MKTETRADLKFQIEVITRFNENESLVDKSLFFFNYKISISNLGSHSAQLLTRYWLIEDGLGRKEEVRGPGVVGLQPNIHPGETFQYESACPLSTSHGMMSGFYEMMDENKNIFRIEVPEFYLIAPQALH